MMMNGIRVPSSEEKNPGVGLSPSQLFSVRSLTRWFSRSIMDKRATVRGVASDAASAQPASQELSRREREVLELICEGADDKAIAARLHLSSNTVRNHVSRLYAKIGVNRRSAAVIWARERGIGGRS